MAEWSKAVDLSPTISGCAGSNPAWRILIFFNINNNFRAIINYPTLKKMTHRHRGSRHVNPPFIYFILLIIYEHISIYL